MIRSIFRIFPNEPQRSVVPSRSRFRFCRLSSDDDDRIGVSRSVQNRFRHKLRTASPPISPKKFAEYVHVVLLQRVVSPEGLGFAVCLMNGYEGVGNVDD